MSWSERGSTCKPKPDLRDSPVQACGGRVGLVIDHEPGSFAVDPIHLFDLAGKQARWLSTDQSVIASNVANASTPGYRARSLQPFSEVLDKTGLQLASTAPSHLSLDPLQVQAASIKEENPWEVTESGNSVALEQELIKAGDVNRAYSLNTGIVKTFHAMLMSAAK